MISEGKGCRGSAGALDGFIDGSTVSLERYGVGAPVPAIVDLSGVVLPSFEVPLGGFELIHSRYLRYVNCGIKTPRK